MSTYTKVSKGIYLFLLIYTLILSGMDFVLHSFVVIGPIFLSNYEYILHVFCNHKLDNSGFLSTRVH